MALWARPTGTIKNAVAQGIPRKDPGRSVAVCVTLVDGSDSEVIRATRGNKEPEGQIRQAIREENKSGHYAGKESTGECSAVMERGSD